jgi:predicted Zn finger-like uncharacterized protein
MRIACPTCQAAYEVPDTLLRPPAPGAAARKVKCARCGNAWAPEVPEAAPAPMALPAPVPSPGPQAALPPPDPPPVSMPAPVTAPTPVVVPAADALPPAEPDDLPPPPVVAPSVAMSAAASGPAPAPRVAEKLTPAEPPSEAARGPGLVLAILAWVASLAVLGGAGWAALRWREAVMAAWGPSRRVYEWLGLM